MNCKLYFFKTIPYKGRKATKSEMLKLLERGMSKPKVAKELGVSVASVYDVLKVA